MRTLVVSLSLMLVADSVQGLAQPGPEIAANLAGMGR